MTNTNQHVKLQWIKGSLSHGNISKSPPKNKKNSVLRYLLLKKFLHSNEKQIHDYNNLIKIRNSFQTNIIPRTYFHAFSTPYFISLVIIKPWNKELFSFPRSQAKIILRSNLHSLNESTLFNTFSKWNKKKKIFPINNKYKIII